MNETIINYLHVTPLLIMAIFAIIRQLCSNSEFGKNVRKKFIGIQLLLISAGVGSTVFHSHEEILRCNICLAYSTLLVLVAFRLLYTNNSQIQSKQRV